MAQAIRTTDHERIRKWAESRGGHPAHVRQTGRGKGDLGILRIDFPGYSGEGKLEEISWDQFFDTFDEKGLAFIYQERTSSGRPSRFGKFVARESGDGAPASAKRPAPKRKVVSTAARISKTKPAKTKPAKRSR